MTTAMRGATAIAKDTLRGPDEVLAEDIRAIIAEHPFAGRESQPQGRITISIGVATFPENGTTPTALISAADTALYDAKRNGRNLVCLAS